MIALTTLTTSYISGKKQWHRENCGKYLIWGSIEAKYFPFTDMFSHDLGSVHTHRVQVAVCFYCIGRSPLQNVRSGSCDVSCLMLGRCSGRLYIPPVTKCKKIHTASGLYGCHFVLTWKKSEKKERSKKSNDVTAAASEFKLHSSHCGDA